MVAIQSLAEDVAGFNNLKSRAMLAITSRKPVSFDRLIQAVQQAAGHIPDPRQGPIDYFTTDAVLSGVAIFSLKDPSLLSFQELERLVYKQRLLDCP